MSFARVATSMPTTSLAIAPLFLCLNRIASPVLPTDGHNQGPRQQPATRTATAARPATIERHAAGHRSAQSEGRLKEWSSFEEGCRPASIERKGSNQQQQTRERDKRQFKAQRVLEPPRLHANHVRRPQLGVLHSGEHSKEHSVPRSKARARADEWKAQRAARSAENSTNGSAAHTQQPRKPHHNRREQRFQNGQCRQVRGEVPTRLTVQASPATTVISSRSRGRALTT